MRLSAVGVPFQGAVAFGPMVPRVLPLGYDGAGHSAWRFTRQDVLKNVKALPALLLGSGDERVGREGPFYTQFYGRLGAAE